MSILLLYLSKVTNFKQITTIPGMMTHRMKLLLYLSKVTNFKQITTKAGSERYSYRLLLYLSKVTNFKQITTFGWMDDVTEHCCFTSQR